MLDKRLLIGGLQVGGPRTMQNSARFRVCNNVYKTNDDYMVPRFGNNNYLFFDSDIKVVQIARYKRKVFAVCTSKTTNEWKFFYDSNDITPAIGAPFFPTIALGPNDTMSLGIQFIEEQGCLFFNIPIIGMFKFDGTQVYRAGVPTPRFYPGGAGGTTWIRVIQHHIDFQANVVHSGYVQFNQAPSSGNITINTAGNALDILQPLAYNLYSVSPIGRADYDQPLVGYDVFYFRSSALASEDADSFTLTTGGDHYVADGCYVMVYAEGNPFSLNDYSRAVKVLSSTATTVTISKHDSKILTLQRVWQVDPNPIAAVFVSYATNLWLSVWSSTSATANYVFKDLVPAFPKSPNTANVTINVSSPTVPDSGAILTAFNLAGNMGDVYDVTTVKHPFPAISEENGSLSFCTYGSLGLISQGNEIYFSDTSLGGSFEMTTALSFIVVGAGQDGPVQTIQGTSDFLVISRQFKNYYISGNLPTANYRVSPISETSLGAYSNESSIAVSEKVIFFNKVGIWAVSTGGKCEQLSYNIKGLFENFSRTSLYGEDIFWDVSQLPTYLIPEGISADFAVNAWMRLRFDDARNLVFFMFPGEDQRGKILVLDMNNGEFYTWSELILPTVDSPILNDIVFIEGNYYATLNDGTSSGVNKENKQEGTNRYDYFQYAPPTLTTTWFTAGEPSLEKKVLQVKIWGLYSGGIDYFTAIDWRDDLGSPVIQESIVPPPGTFSHKLRFQPANAMSHCITFVLRPELMEIEGMELEWMPLQEVMKK